jgi:DNA-binding NtrC family response regulator
MRTPRTASHNDAGGIVGQSLAIVRLKADISRVARFASNVLITGPSGTGKELVARQIHLKSPRAQHPFIPVDCASMSGELMASQLFGHVAGAFTGANCEALGCFRAANGGTLFLDEIGELEFPLQAKLLRVLQEHAVTPVGSHQCQRVDVRVVAATNRNLRLDVVGGRFREDLYYRLDVVHLRTTALRERPEDIRALADAFLGQLAEDGFLRCSLSAEAGAVLTAFDWPGNVRQLRNVLEQAAIDSLGPVVSGELIHRIISRPFAAEEMSHSDALFDNAVERGCSADFLAVADIEFAAQEPAARRSVKVTWPTLEFVEQQHIVRTLAHTFHNRSAAARLLGVTRQSLLRKMKRHGLTLPAKKFPSH